MSLEPTPLDHFREAVRRAGGQKKFGKAVGCTQANISKLLLAESPLPARYVLPAEAATGVSRYDLRPDIYPREPAPLAQQAAA